METAPLSGKGLEAGMKAAFRPEYLVFCHNNLSLTFPAGTLPSQEHACGWGPGRQEPEGLIRPEALPVSGQ